MIKKATKQGFSTKGRNRGYGMANIWDIVKRRNLTLESYLEDPFTYLYDPYEMMYLLMECDF